MILIDLSIKTLKQALDILKNIPCLELPSITNRYQRKEVKSENVDRDEIYKWISSPSTFDIPSFTLVDLTPAKSGK